MRASVASLSVPLAYRLTRAGATIPPLSLLPGRTWDLTVPAMMWFAAGLVEHRFATPPWLAPMSAPTMSRRPC